MSEGGSEIEICEWEDPNPWIKKLLLMERKTEKKWYYYYF
jgi:hypothetical protein